MLPRQPPRGPSMGFLYVPPFRIQGLSVAGEQTSIQVPELDVCFDIGLCPRPALASKFVALSHGHMDHSAALSYYFSQRHFQGMGTGTVVCHPDVEEALHGIMKAWVALERQRTPYRIMTLMHDEEIEIKNNHFLRAFYTNHTCPSLGFVILEKRSKLKPELVGLPQEKLVELKNAGEDITMTLEVPLVAYTGDTAWGDFFDREDVLNAQVLITECTFLDPGDRNRASVGKHLHISDVQRLVRRSHAEAVVLVHMSRRTNMHEARKQIDRVIDAGDRDRVLVLMDSRANRDRYEQQQQGAEAVEA